MPMPFAPIDAATITALNGGDEKALERIFRTHYDALLERATDRLKDEPAAAPRLVAACVREFWEERAGFHSSGEIEAFFNEELRHRARAVRARMAAVHRFEKHEGVGNVGVRPAPTADELWAEIRESLHKPPVDAAAAAKRRREHAAHDAASHIAQVANRRNWRKTVALGSLGAVVLIGAIWWINRASEQATIAQLLASADAETVTTRPGQLGQLELADGSRVRLAAESRLVVVPQFGRKYRVATLGGSASFAVAPDNPVAMEIRVGDVAVRASTGEFAVRDYADDSLRFVTARSDGIRVTGTGGDRTLSAGQTVAIDRTGAIRDASEAEAAQSFAWLDGKLLLREVTVADATRRLWRWYGMDVAVRDSVGAERRITIEVPLESSRAALDAIAAAGNLVFGYDSTKMVFRSPAQAAQAAQAARTGRRAR
jgi:ferric-dicitrate binding protein FerR (iron transport regulator)